MKRLLALSLLALALAPPSHRPYCAGWQQAMETPQGTLVLVPVVANRTEQTQVEVWVHTHVGSPRSAIGWAQGAADLPAGWAVLWTEHGLAQGPHAVTMELFEAGVRVDGWQRPSQCLTTVEVAKER